MVEREAKGCEIDLRLVFRQLWSYRIWLVLATLALAILGLFFGKIKYKKDVAAAKLFEQQAVQEQQALQEEYEQQLQALEDSRETIYYAWTTFRISFTEAEKNSGMDTSMSAVVNLTTMYSGVLKNSSIPELVAQAVPQYSLSATDVRNSMLVSVVEGSPVLQVYVSAEYPDMAKELLAQLMEKAPAAMSDMIGIGMCTVDGTVYEYETKSELTETIAPLELPEITPVVAKNKSVKFALLGAIVGFAMSACVVLALGVRKGMLNLYIAGPADVEKYLNLPLLGEIPMSLGAQQNEG